MQFKSLLTLASVAAVAVAAPNAIEKRDAVTAQTLTSHFTTETFTATRVLQSMMQQSPWVTVLTTETTWTVAHTVTTSVPSATARK